MKKGTSILTYLFLSILFSTLFFIGCKKNSSSPPPIVNDDGDYDLEKPANIKIGGKFGGGIIFSLDSTGKHGLIAHERGLALHATWGCKGVSVPDLKSEFGTGQANTNKILAVCSTPGTAARICDSLVSHGYSDWYLPSKDELIQMYLRDNDLLFTTNKKRWSSTEKDSNSAWSENFDSTAGANLPRVDPKNFDLGVRPVRSF